MDKETIALQRVNPQIITSDINFSVVIVSWNSGEYLPKCLNCLSNQTHKNFEVIIVDNGSTDNSLKNIHQSYPNIKMRLHFLGTNTGFAVANNIGVSMALGNWIALLNSDAFPEPDWLEQFSRAIKTYPDFGFFASRQIQAKSIDLLDGEGDAYHFSGLAWRRRYNEPVSEKITAYEVFSPCAAAAIYKKDLFFTVGGFDEDYFSYFEDVDLGFRLRLIGAKCLYIPTAIVKHVGSASTGKESDFAIYYGYRNLIWTYFKDMPSPLFFIYLPAHFFMIFITIWRYSIKGKFITIFRAVISGILGMPTFFPKRSIIQKSTTVNIRELKSVIEYNYDVLYAVFLRMRFFTYIRLLTAKFLK